MSAHYLQMHTRVVFCPHWSVVVGPTTTQPILTTTQPTLTTTQPTFSTTNRVKAAKCCIFTHNLTTTHTILGRTLLFVSQCSDTAYYCSNNIAV